MKSAMNTSDLKNRAAGRRTKVIKPLDGWHCTYCKKNFTYERSFMTHVCKGKQKLEQLQSLTGQIAYGAYCGWMKAKRFSIPKIETFGTSIHFNAFYRFAQYAQQLGLNADYFVNTIMKVASDIPPSLWTSPEVYSLYLEQYDKLNNPYDQFVDSIEYLNRQAEILNCSPAEVPYKLGFNRFLEAIRTKKMSPWLMFMSKKIMKYISTLDEAEIKLIDSSIVCSAWNVRLAKNQELQKEFQEITLELGLS